ncbi:MAG: polymer-forming cytoskeletal protein [Gemmatimonadaceae bacterium]
MAIWKEQVAPKKDPAPFVPEPVMRKEADTPVDLSSNFELQRRPVPRSAESKESLIASDITIEGKIEGAGHVRIAGRFKGDVHVQGNLTIEPGAKLTGGVRANAVVIAGEVEGNIDDAARVELLDSGVLNGDLKAGSLTVAAGSRMRGRVEFGWDDKVQTKSVTSSGNGSAL